MTITIARYMGSTPGADSNVYPLFNTVTAFSGARMPQGAGLKRITCAVKHDEVGAFRLSKSIDRGVNWHIIDEQAATFVAADEEDVYDAMIEPYDDFKVDWVNGGAAQTTWVPSISLSNERSPA